MIKQWALVLFLGFSACWHSFAQWSNHSQINTQVAEGSELSGVRISRTSDSFTYILWINGFYHGSFCLTLLDEHGQPVWSPETKLFGGNYETPGYGGYILTTDQNGDALVISSNLKSYEAGSDVVFYKIDKSGNMAWGEGGIEFNTPDFWEMQLSAVVNARNELIAAYSSVNNNDSRIIVHKVETNGSLSWGNLGVVISYPDCGYLWPGLAIQDDNECLISFIRYSGDYPYQREILANKMDRNGRMVWDKDIIVSNSFDIPPSHFLTSKSGPNGELILGWLEAPLIWLATANFQVIMGDGSTWFSQGGIQVSTNYDFNQFLPKIAGIREDGNLYVFFEQTDIHQRKRDLYGQCLSADRGRLWGDHGKKLIDSIPNRDLLTTLVNDSIVIMFTQDFKGDSNSSNILSLSNVTSQGEFGWTDSTMTLGQFNAQKSNLALSNTSTDETALAWLEILPSGNRMVKAQNIFNNGRIGSFSDFIDHPITGDKFFLGYNPVSNCLIFNNLIGNDRIVIHDINGGLVLNKEGKDIVAFQSQKPGLFIVEIFRGQIRLESNKFVVF